MKHIHWSDSLTKTGKTDLVAFRNFDSTSPHKVSFHYNKNQAQTGQLIYSEMKISHILGNTITQ